VLMLRQQAARTSVRKYNAIEKSVGADERLRFTFQFAGASRTSRWSGRRFQPQNLARPPKELEADKKMLEVGAPKDYLMTLVTDTIRENDYDTLCLLTKEPMNYLAGLVRSSIRAPSGFDFVVADLSAIETCVTAWLSGCDRLLNVLRTGGDPYIDFGTDLYKKPAAEISKFERQCSKPAVLGCTYRLGGGELREGKRTGLWGYAEGMGVNFTQEESARAVATFRRAYPEIPKTWFALEEAVHKAITTHREQVPSFYLNGRRVTIPVRIEYRKPYLMMWLPSGRPLYYHLPRITEETFRSRDGEPYKKKVFSYMGKQQNGNAWIRVKSHGGKIIENLVQAIARDVLKAGLLAAKNYGFNICGHVHDEIITLQRKGDNQFTLAALIDCMKAELDWAPGLPLGAAGYAAPFYRKD
jgi:DNA polymerase bacteriophage-type